MQGKLWLYLGELRPIKPTFNLPRNQPPPTFAFRNFLLSSGIFFQRSHSSQSLDRAHCPWEHTKTSFSTREPPFFGLFTSVSPSFACVRKEEEARPAPESAVSQIPPSALGEPELNHHDEDPRSTMESLQLSQVLADLSNLGAAVRFYFYLYPSTLTEYTSPASVPFLINASRVYRNQRLPLPSSKQTFPS